MPLTDVESVMRETRVIAHQATAGAQTPWQETNPSEPPFTFPLNADPAQVQAASATLPDLDRRRSAPSILKALTGPRCGAMTSPITRPISAHSAPPRRPSAGR